MPGKYMPPNHGTLPERGVKILDTVYENTRARYPTYSKEQCAKIAWSTVEKNGFYKAKCGKWIDTKSSKYTTMFKREMREHKDLSTATIKRIVEDHWCAGVSG